MTDPMVTPADEPPLQPSGRRARDVRLVVTGVVAVLLVWFAVANLQGVSIRFWLTSAKAPLIVVIVISVALGSLGTALVSKLSRRRRSPEGPA